MKNDDVDGIEDIDTDGVSDTSSASSQDAKKNTFF